jgi:hypothetical protein
MMRSPVPSINRTGQVLFVLGALALVASVAWIALALYVEDVVR